MRTHCRLPGASILAAVAAMAALGACQHRPEATERWGHTHAPAVPARPAPPPVVYTPPVVEAPVVVAEAPDAATTVASSTGVRSFTTGCNGSFTVVDAQGRAVRSGRAHNTGSGLVMLDARGSRGAPVAQAGAGQTLLFLPDCNCNARADRGGDTQLAGTTPASAQCNAG